MDIQYGSIEDKDMKMTYN